jgi:hypothetical protein
MMNKNNYVSKKLGLLTHIIVISVFVMTPVTGYSSEMDAVHIETRNKADLTDLPTPFVNIKNVSDKSVNLISLTDGKKHYRIGHVSIEDIVRDITTTSFSQERKSEENVKEIYKYISNAFSHKCSNGSFLTDIRENETVLQRLYSYSFGCCTDVNQPILSTFYKVAGISAYSVTSKYHSALQVCLENSCPNDSSFYVDGDMNRILKGNINELRKSDNLLAGLFPDGQLYKSTEGKLPLPPVIKDGPMSFSLYPNEEIIFSLTTIRSNVVNLPYPGDPPSIPDGTSPGVAYLNLSNYAVGEFGQCTDYVVNSPYVVQKAELLNAGNKETLFVRYKEAHQSKEELVPFNSSKLNISSVPKKIIRGTMNKNLMQKNWGGYSARYYIPLKDNEQIITDSNEPTYTSKKGSMISFRIFENGQRIGSFNSDHKAIINDGYGRYNLYQRNHLIFSSSDGSNPKDNKHIYSYEVEAYPILYDAKGRYKLAFRVCGDQAKQRKLRVDFQYNRNIFPGNYNELVVLPPSENVTLTISP